MRLCCVQRGRMLKRCLQRQIFTEEFLHHIFMCSSGCISHSQRRETERNADLCIPEELISGSHILLPKTKLPAVFYIFEG